LPPCVEARADLTPVAAMPLSINGSPRDTSHETPGIQVDARDGWPGARGARGLEARSLLHIVGALRPGVRRCARMQRPHAVPQAQAQAQVQAQAQAQAQGDGARIACSPSPLPRCRAPSPPPRAWWLTSSRSRFEPRREEVNHQPRGAGGEGARQPSRSQLKLARRPSAGSSTPGGRPRGLRG